MTVGGGRRTEECTPTSTHPEHVHTAHCIGPITTDNRHAHKLTPMHTHLINCRLFNLYTYIYSILAVPCRTRCIPDLLWKKQQPLAPDCPLPAHTSRSSKQPSNLSQSYRVYFLTCTKFHNFGLLFSKLTFIVERNYYFFLFARNSFIKTRRYPSRHRDTGVLLDS